MRPRHRAKKPVVAIGGATHSSDAERAHDRRREAFLTAQGFRVLRVHNAEVTETIDSVLETILAALERRETW